MTTSQYNMSTSLAKCKTMQNFQHTVESNPLCLHFLSLCGGFASAMLPPNHGLQARWSIPAWWWSFDSFDNLINMVCHIIQILHRSVCTFHKFRIFEQLQILYLIYSNLTPSSCMHRYPNFLAHKSNIITLYATILCEPMSVTIVCFDNAST